MHHDDASDLLTSFRPAGGETDRDDLWRQALAAAGDAVWVWDVVPDRMQYCGALASWLGLAPEALGRTEAEGGLLQHPDDRPEVLRRLTQHLAGTQPQFSAEYRMRCADGSYRWILARGKVVQRDASGQARRLIGTHIDTTRRKERERGLSEAGAELARAREVIPDLMFEIDGQGRPLDAACVHEGSWVSLLASMAHPEAVLRQRQLALEEAALQGASCGHRYELALGVTRRWHEMSIYRRQDLVEGQPRYLMVVRDVTHQKALEDELRIIGKVFESQQALMLIDPARTVVRVNRALCELLGCERDELVGRKSWELLQGTWLPQSARPEFWAGLDARGELSEECTVLRAHGELVALWCSLTVVQDERGEVTHYACLVSDVTERRRRQEELEAKNLAQRQALVREVHHRIKNNLQGIVGILRAFGHNHPDTVEAVDHVVTQVQSVAVIHGLQGRTALDQVRVCELTSSIAQGLATLFQTDIEMDIPQPWQPCLLAPSEAVPVALILNELLLNAVKHRSDPAASVCVSLRKGDQPDRVRVSIRNAGAWQAAPSDNHIGLSLVDSLMPRSGARLTRSQQEGAVHTVLELGPPVISLLPEVLP